MNLSKKGIRALGISESFHPRDKESILAGVVMRADLVIDGVRFSTTVVQGDDASDKIIEVYKSFGRNDINIIMVGGAVISLYNIIDPEKIYRKVDLPVVLVTYKESQGLAGALRKNFPTTWKEKLRKYRVLGRRIKIPLKSGYHVFVRSVGISETSVRPVLDRFTLQGSVPEPIRVAKMIAKAKLDAELPS